MRSRVSTASTAGLDVADRVAYWEEYNADHLVGLRCSTYLDEGLEARQVNLDLGSVNLAEISGNAHVIDRTSRHVADTPKDSVFLTYLTEGSAFFLHPQGSVRLGPGDIILYDPSRPYLFGFESRMSKKLLDVPREALSGLDLDALPLVRLGSLGDARGAAFAALMQSAMNTGGDGDAGGGGVGADLLNAAVALIWPDEAAGTALCDAARSAVRDRIGDPHLTADAVAAYVGVSARHLNRLFAAAEGMTVTQYIQRQRLHGARRDLADPAYAQVRIADIAVRWAFSSQAHLARLFGREFGCRPSDVRPEGRDASGV